MCISTEILYWQSCGAYRHGGCSNAGSNLYSFLSYNSLELCESRINFLAASCMSQRISGLSAPKKPCVQAGPTRTCTSEIWASSSSRVLWISRRKVKPQHLAPFDIRRPGLSTMLHSATETSTTSLAVTLPFVLKRGLSTIQVILIIIPPHFPCFS